MARQLRVQFPGAIYHFVTRGDGRNLRLEKRSMDTVATGSSNQPHRHHPQVTGPVFL